MLQALKYDFIVYAPDVGPNYTISDKIKPLSMKTYIGEPPEIHTGCYRGDPGQHRNSGSSYDKYKPSFWLNRTVWHLCHWNFHLLSFWLALVLLWDVSYVMINENFPMITSPLLSNVHHRAMIMPVSLSLTRLIHISPSCWRMDNPNCGEKGTEGNREVFPHKNFKSNFPTFSVHTSAFQPVRQYALVRMRKPCGADDKHGADECGWENPVLLL